MMGFPLEPIEKASIAELRTLQLERLKLQLAHAYDNVPHYRKKFEAAGVKPKHLKELRDLARFPFTTKTDLRDTYPFGMFAVPMDQVVRIHASSGTTGKPTVVGYTKGDLDLWSDLMARSLACAGARLVLAPDWKPIRWTEAERKKGQAWGLQTVHSFHTYGTPPVEHAEDKPAKKAGS